jgi:hypothetical protein
LRSKLLGTVIAVLGLGLGTSAFALSSNGHRDDDQGKNVQLHGSGRSFRLLSFLGGWGDHQDSIERIVGAIRSGYGSSRWQNGSGGSWYTKPPRDAGYVPEPGAVGVFSVGLLMAGALIRRFGRKA